jgi:hypothetical protein
MDKSLQSKWRDFVGDKLASEWEDLLQEFLRSGSFDAIAPKTQIKTCAISISNKGNSCIKCNKDHYIRECPSFINMTIKHRIKYVAQKELCGYCLSNEHTSSDCHSRFSCYKCKGRHHSMLCDHLAKL